MTLLGILGKDASSWSDVVKAIGGKYYEDEVVSLIADVLIDYRNLVKATYISPTTTAEMLQNLREAFIPFEYLAALVLYDRSKQQFCLYTDYIGLNQIYYSFCNGNVFFSSDVKLLARILNRSIDQRVLTTIYLRRGYIPPPYTIFSKIYKLHPGTGLCIDLKNYYRNFYKFFDIYEIRPLKNIGYLQAEELVNDTLQHVIERSFQWKNKYGVLLSGGLDSGSIAAFAKKIRNDIDLKGITLANLPEAIYARQIAQYLDIELLEVYLDQTSFLKALISSFQHLQEPLAGIGIIPQTYALLKEAKERGLEIIVTGDLGDEIFSDIPASLSKKGCIKDTLGFLTSYC